MDTVVLDGVRYVKASVAAKDFRYTSDYIGQLCRSKKIDARLVGRTWFVNAESIREHKRNRHSKTSTQVPSTNPESEKDDLTKEIKPLRKAIPPVVKSKTAKQFAAATTESEQSRSRRLIVWYEPDQETLIPHLIKKVQPSKTVRVEAAGAKKVRVTGHKKVEVNFTPSALPDVALSGKLTITSFPDKSTDVTTSEVDKGVNTAKNKAMSPDRDSGQSSSSKQRPVIKMQTSLPKIAAVKPASKLPKKEKRTVSATNKVDQQSSVATTQSILPTTFTPASVKSSSTSSQVSPLVRVSPLIATVTAFACVLLLFSASSKIVASDSFYQSQLILQVANLVEIFNHQW